MCVRWQHIYVCILCACIVLKCVLLQHSNFTTPARHVRIICCRYTTYKISGRRAQGRERSFAQRLTSVMLWVLTHNYMEHTHTRLTALCPGLPGWASTRKVRPICILLKQETVSVSGISWAIWHQLGCKLYMEHSKIWKFNSQYYAVQIQWFFDSVGWVTERSSLIIPVKICLMPCRYFPQFVEEK